MDEAPVGLLQAAAALLLARYALHREPCIAQALERVFVRLAAHPAVCATPALADGYRALALTWKEALSLDPSPRERAH